MENQITSKTMKPTHNMYFYGIHKRIQAASKLINFNLLISEIVIVHGQWFW